MECLIVKRVLILVSMIAAIQKVTNALLNEPDGCNRFSFEEKVLEKLIVLDHTVKTSLEKFEDKISQLNAEHVQHRETMQRFREGLDGMEDDLKAFKDKLNARMNSQETEHSQFLKEAENVQDTLKGEVRNALLSVNETMHKDTAARKPTAAMEQTSYIKHEQVAFVALRPTKTLVLGSPTFSKINLNMGGGYNVSAGTFTAPVAGLYSFSVTLMAAYSRTGTQEVYCWVKQNSTSVALVSTRDGQHDSSTVSVFLKLSLDDIVHMSCGGWNYVHTGAYSSFTGALIRAD